MVFALMLAAAHALPIGQTHGPSPAALDVQGGSWAVAGGAALRAADALVAGAELDGAFAVAPPLIVSGRLAYGAADPGCPACRASTGTLAVVAPLLRRPAIVIAPWAWATSNGRVLDTAVGASLDVGTRHARFDVRGVILSNLGVAELVARNVEIGVTGRWTDAHHTRLSVVGIEPAVGVSHRVRIDRWWLDATLHAGEPGPGGAVRIGFGGAR